jgi:hypothetical protein
LVAAGAASAKGIRSGTVCGQNECFAVHGEASAALFSWETSEPWAELEPPLPAPYYTMRFRIDQAPTVDVLEQVLYVPSRHMVRVYDSRTVYGPQPVGPYWRSVSKSAERAMNQVVSKLPPHHAPRAWARPS